MFKTRFYYVKKKCIFNIYIYIKENSRKDCCNVVLGDV